MPRAGPTTPGSATRRWAVIAALITGSLLLSGCQQAPRAEAQRIEQLNLKIQQLEERLNKLSERHDGADKQGKPPAGVIKSLTIRTGTEDNRLRIYWGDGSTTDLPCTKEQATFVCG
jgi:outer membrane murein-binding lipoprotein Lpp